MVTIALVVLIAFSVNAAILYGSNVTSSAAPGEVLYRIDTVAATVTPICDIGAVHGSLLAPGNANSPNGLGYDAANQRLYFSVNNSSTDGDPSALWFYDMIGNTLTYAGMLAGQAAGATFDQSTGQYLYIKNTTDDLQTVSLNENGTINTESTLVAGFSGEDNIYFRGGDLAINCDRVVYGSSLGSGGGSKVFFKIELNNGNAYTLIHQDPSGDNANTGYATAKQVSFGDDETLFSTTGGLYWEVDLSTGLQTPAAGFSIPAAGPITMSDLASGLDCTEPPTPTGCTLTYGYWKTHSNYGPAPWDMTWSLLADGADTPFFSTGNTYYEILSMPPKKGNAYLILAHQYIAAELNGLSGASMPPEVSDAMTEAVSLLTSYAGVLNIPDDPDRAYAIALAEILDMYNNGYIGPGHCSGD